MGGGRWSTNVYKEKEDARKRSGKSAFAYSDQAKRSGKLKAHESLDPMDVGVRESRDSDEHPESNSIMVFFDVTGSMGQVPVGLQKYLPQLLGLLLYKNYVPHPQIFFGAVGDAYTDRVPLQVGQFESDNRMDEHLQNIVLEGGGGGQKRESYDLAFYFASRHTAMDCWDKRGVKGYLFIIGDEMGYPNILKAQVNALMGDGLEADIPIEEIVQEVKQKFNLFYIIPQGAHYGKDQEVSGYWKDLLGEQHVVELSDPQDVAETIALIIGTSEGTIGLDEGLEHLREFGTDADRLSNISKALSMHTGNSSLVKGKGGSLSNLDNKKSGTRRL